MRSLHSRARLVENLVLSHFVAYYVETMLRTFVFIYFSILLFETSRLARPMPSHRLHTAIGKEKQETDSVAKTIVLPIATAETIVAMAKNGCLDGRSGRLDG